MEQYSNPHLSGTAHIDDCFILRISGKTSVPIRSSGFWMCMWSFSDSREVQNKDFEEKNESINHKLCVNDRPLVIGL